MVEAWPLLFQLLPLMFIVGVVTTAYYCYARHIPLDDPPPDSCLPEYHLELPQYSREEEVHLPPAYDAVVEPLEGERMGSSSTERLVAELEPENPNGTTEESVALPMDSNEGDVPPPEPVYNQQ
jgi:hypothetical protein